MPQNGVATDWFKAPGGCVLSPAIGSMVVSKHLEEIRIALIEQAEGFARIEGQWKVKSPSAFHEEFYGYFCRVARGPSAWNQHLTLVDWTRKILRRTSDMVFASGGGDQSQYQLRDILLPGTEKGIPVQIPERSVVVSGELWPFWLESIRASRSGEFASSTSVHDFCFDVLRAPKLVGAYLYERLRAPVAGTLTGDQGDSDLETGLYELLDEAIDVLEETITRIAASLRMLCLAIEKTEGAGGDIEDLEDRLSESAGFQQVGPRLLQVLASRLQTAEFVTTREELSMLTGASRPAVDSAVAAMKAQHVLLPTGFGKVEQLWATPIICSLAERYGSHADDLECEECPVIYGEQISGEEPAEAEIPAEHCTVPAVEPLLHAAPAPIQLQLSVAQPSAESVTVAVGDPASQAPAKHLPAVLNEFTPSQDYRSAVHNSVTHSFTTNQARCVEYLHEQWKNGTPEVAISTVLEKIDSTGNRLDQVFRNTKGDKKGTHAAWKTLIVSGETKGSVRLNIAGPAPLPTK